MYMPGGQAFFGPILNSIVHAIMYTYYGLSGETFNKLKCNRNFILILVSF